MGEYAEMMLDGTCCECCGEYIGRATGFPGYCSRQCAADRGMDVVLKPKAKKKATTLFKTHICKDCGKAFALQHGHDQHRHAKCGNTAALARQKEEK